MELNLLKIYFQKLRRVVNILALEIISNFFSVFILGLLTPLGAVCVLPLYPGFLVHLSSNVSEKESDRKSIAVLGATVSVGVIVFMMLFGLIFTTILQVSLSNVIGVVSPIAFGILTIISLLLIFNIDFGEFIPRFNIPVAKNPLLSSFVFGFFFGAIVIPCNPLFIAALFVRTLSTVAFFENIINFLFFGAGMAFPLLVFSLFSTAFSRKIISYMTKYKRSINLIAGITMLAISLYYLLFVFNVLG